MKRALDIGHNDLRIFFRQRAWYVWLFIMPLAFTYFMGFAVQGPGSPGAPQLGLLIENEDPGFLGGILLQELGEQGLRLLGPTNRNEAKRGLKIPPDFTERVLKKEKTSVGFFTVSGSGDEAAALVEVRLVRALIALHGHLVEHALATAGQPPSEDALRDLMRRENPVVLDSKYAGRKPIPTGFNLSLPGNLVMYLMMNLLIFGGATVAAERRSGVLRRLAVHPVSRAALVTGKIYGLMLLGCAQIALLLAVGRVLLGVDMSGRWFSILVTLLVYAWVAASLGVLIGSVVTAEEKIIGLCLLLSLPMAALGGCWWPLEIVPVPLQIVAHLIPTGWAMDALHQLISFGGGFAQAKEEIGVLLLFGAAANFAAAKCFRC
ncbi:MAG: ABC transporter permease [Verrucomicrobia bacterium]|nr:ABC transporter permease [Verrucomicrobiota bacterium]